MDLDRVPLWRGDHVPIKQLAEDFARYLYLPRLGEPAVLVEAARDGVALVTWEQDSFANADAYDEAAGRYRGLRSIHPSSTRPRLDSSYGPKSRADSLTQRRSLCLAGARQALQSM